MDKSKYLKDTEQRNPASVRIDTKSTEEILHIINDEDAKVVPAVKEEIPRIANVVDSVVDSFIKGGRLLYIGAGTSGRLGVLDASECPPTYGVSPDLVVGIIAGGDKALRNSIEGAEDDGDKGIEDLKSHSLSSVDTVIGISANGDAPYVVEALKYAKSIGANTAMISSNSNAKAFLYVVPDHRIVAKVGPEVILGSTRMKSGTAQKLILNMITTASMIKMGKVYDNYMVDLRPVNKKLVQRSVDMISEITDVSEEVAIRVFEESGRNVKLAVVMASTGLDRNKAEELLTKNSGNIHLAVDSLSTSKRE
ncbi:MAG: N-acetylmuramic acid 6-phosphate etherase [Spirochaetales bacterium]|nr:N-acetylmuramic acid 6-phosphate etherase [Spirochaetales bacterium]